MFSTLRRLSTVSRKARTRKKVSKFKVDFSISNRFKVTPFLIHKQFTS